MFDTKITWTPFGMFSSVNLKLLLLNIARRVSINYLPSIFITYQKTSSIETVSTYTLDISNHFIYSTMVQRKRVLAANRPEQSLEIQNEKVSTCTTSMLPLLSHVTNGYTVGDLDPSSCITLYLIRKKIAMPSHHWNPLLMEIVKHHKSCFRVCSADLPPPLSFHL